MFVLKNTVGISKCKLQRICRRNEVHVREDLTAIPKPEQLTKLMVPEGVSSLDSPSGKELIWMVENSNHTNEYEGEDILKGSPETIVHTFLKEGEKVLTQYMPSLHWNTLYTKEDFAKQLMVIARHGDFISNGSRVYNFKHSGSSGDTLLHHLHNLDMETVQNLYDKANKSLLQLAKKYRVYKSGNVQLAVDFVAKLFYGEHRDEWVWKKKIDGEWERMYMWILVSLVDRNQKYPLYIELAPASAARAEGMAQLLTSVLEKVHTFYKISSGRVYVDREFFSTEVINALKDFCEHRKMYWLMPAKRTSRVKKTLEPDKEGIFNFYITNKKRKRAYFILVLARNEEGILHPFATNIWLKIPKKLYPFYRRRWQIETNIRSIRHPFLINTASVHTPTRDFLMRLAVLCCFIWMLINAVMIKETDFNHWITNHMFIVLLFNTKINENPQMLKKAFTKAPLSARITKSGSSLSIIAIFCIKLKIMFILS